MESPTNYIIEDISNILKTRSEDDAKFHLDSQRQHLASDYHRDRLTRETYVSMMGKLDEAEKHFGWETPESWRSTAA